MTPSGIEPATFRLVRCVIMCEKIMVIVEIRNRKYGTTNANKDAVIDTLRKEKYTQGHRK